jgi:hypothetical protein
MTNSIWGNNRHEIKEAILFAEPDEGGIGLPCILTKIVTAKLCDIANIIFSNHDKDLADMLIKSRPKRNNSSFWSNLTTILKLAKIKIIEVTDNSFIICTSPPGGRLLMSASTKFKDVYHFITNANKIKETIVKRLHKSSMKYSIPHHLLLVFCRCLWRSKHILPKEKNIFYRLVFNNFRDKQILWLANARQDPVCAFCDEDFETYEHILLSCKIFQRQRALLGIEGWDHIFNNKRPLNMKFAYNIILGSWTNNIEICIRTIALICRSRHEHLLGPAPAPRHGAIEEAVGVVFARSQQQH